MSNRSNRELIELACVRYGSIADALQRTQLDEACINTLGLSTVLEALQAHRPDITEDRLKAFLGDNGISHGDNDISHRRGQSSGASPLFCKHTCQNRSERCENELGHRGSVSNHTKNPTLHPNCDTSCPQFTKLISSDAAEEPSPTRPAKKRAARSRVTSRVAPEDNLSVLLSPADAPSAVAKLVAPNGPSAMELTTDDDNIADWLHKYSTQPPEVQAHALMFMRFSITKEKNRQRESDRSMLL